MRRSAPVLIALVAVLTRAFIFGNPLLFRIRTGEPHDDFIVFQEHEVLDRELAKIKSSIPDKDYLRYRNHCLRVLTFSNYFLSDKIPHRETVMNIIAMALAYHDVALWTDGELNYLEPSVKQMEKNVDREEFLDSQIKLAREIIMEHHKITSYNTGHPTTDEIVNAVRKADWADATMGIIRFGLPAALLEAAYDQIKEAGFHMMLAGFGQRLSPWSITGQLAVLNIFRL